MRHEDLLEKKRAYEAALAKRHEEEAKAKAEAEKKARAEKKAKKPANREFLVVEEESVSEDK